MSDVKKTEEEIKEEAKREFEKEQEIKEKVKKELIAEQEKIERKQNRKVSFVRVIFSLISTVLFLFILFETVMGILDMQRINEDQEPIWYVDSKVEEIDNARVTTYNLGLYVIEKVETNNEKKVGLKPFFIK